VSEMLHLVLPGDRFVKIHAGTVLHLFPSQVYIKVQRAPGGMTQGQGRDQYLASGEDDAGCNNDVADGPVLVIKIEIADGSDICVDCSDRVPGYVFCPSQTHRFFVSRRIFQRPFGPGDSTPPQNPTEWGPRPEWRMRRLFARVSCPVFVRRS